MAAIVEKMCIGKVSIANPSGVTVPSGILASKGPPAVTINTTTLTIIKIRLPFGVYLCTKKKTIEPIMIGKSEATLITPA